MFIGIEISSMLRSLIMSGKIGAAWVGDDDVVADCCRRIHGYFFACVQRTDANCIHPCVLDRSASIDEVAAVDVVQ